jgi:hypothetical protein
LDEVAPRISQDREPAELARTQSSRRFWNRSPTSADLKTSLILLLVMPHVFSARLAAVQDAPVRRLAAQRTTLGGPPGRVSRFLVTNAGCTAIGSSAGLFAYHRNTNANYTLTVRTTDGTGSGWAGAEHNDAGKVDFEGVCTSTPKLPRFVNTQIPALGFTSV